MLNPRQKSSNEKKALLIMMLLLFAVRLLITYTLNVEYTINSDDMAYVNSGFTLLKTGIITCHDQYPSAQIMPGMSIICAGVALVFGEGIWFWRIMKLLWALMGVFSAFYVYRSVRLYSPQFYALLAMIPFFRPDIIWSNNVLLSETPYILCLCAVTFYTLKGSKSESFQLKTLIGWLCFYVIGLMLRAMMMLTAIVSGLYLLICKKPAKDLIKSIVIIAAATAIVLTPWTIRNYRLFNDFLPFGYGMGNPNKLGTFQGQGYPNDEDLDYETNVDLIAREKYANFFNEDGSVKQEYERYVNLRTDELRAKYRLKVWWKNDPLSVIYSYVIFKPWVMISSVFIWDTNDLLESIGYHRLVSIQYVELVLCICSIAAAIHLKKQRKPLLYLCGLYLLSIYAMSISFAIDRYASHVLFLRFIVFGIGLPLIVEVIRKETNGVLNHE